MSDVTVVIPAFNHAAFLGAAIESAIESDIDVDVIVIDDGSSDGTAGVARRYPMISYLFQANAGAAAAINAGIALASSDFVAVLNDDDVFEPWHLRAALEQLGSCRADLCLTMPRLMGSGQLRIQMEAHQQLSHELIRSYGRAFTLLVHNWFVSTSAMVMTKCVWQQLDGFRDLKLCHDLDFALRALVDGAAVTYLEEPSWGYRCHQANTVSGLTDELRQWELTDALSVASGIRLPPGLADFGYGALLPVHDCEGP